jgi:general secretion pathway protein G
MAEDLLDHRPLEDGHNDLELAGAAVRAVLHVDVKAQLQRTTRQVIAQFYGDHGRYPESLEELCERRYLQSLPFDPVAESNTAWRIEAVPEGTKGGVYDIRSTAPGVARDGTPYEQW